MFSGVGAFFAYRAWRQKKEEIREKYFERRFKVFELVNEATSLGMRPGNTQWMPMIVEARRRAEFLFGPDVCMPLAPIQARIPQVSR